MSEAHIQNIHDQSCGGSEFLLSRWSKATFCYPQNVYLPEGNWSSSLWSLQTHQTLVLKAEPRFAPSPAVNLFTGPLREGRSRRSSGGLNGSSKAAWWFISARWVWLSSTSFSINHTTPNERRSSWNHVFIRWWSGVTFPLLREETQVGDTHVHSYVMNISV